MVGKSQKKYVCPIDNRQFATSAALDQHRMDSHTSGMPRGRRGRGGRRGGGARGGLRRGDGSSFIPSAPTRVPGNNSSSIIVSGEDRVAKYTIKANSSGFYNIYLLPSVAERIHTLSRAYQRIKWLSCKFYVSAQTPYTTGGGYVVGFVTDPADESVTLNQLSATQGAKTRKWYETAEVSVPNNSTVYYTHTNVEPRLASPGRFWLLSDGNPSVDINVVVTMIWRVELTQATVADDRTFYMPVDAQSKPDQNWLEYMAKTAAGADTATGKWKSKLSDILKTIGYSENFIFFRVPSFTIQYKEGVGDTGTLQMHYIVYSKEDEGLYYSDNDHTISSTKWQSDVAAQVCVTKGALMRMVNTNSTGKVSVFRETRRRDSSPCSTSQNLLMRSSPSVQRSRSLSRSSSDSIRTSKSGRSGSTGNVTMRLIALEESLSQVQNQLSENIPSLIHQITQIHSRIMQMQVAVSSSDLSGVEVVEESDLNT